MQEFLEFFCGDIQNYARHIPEQPNFTWPCSIRSRPEVLSMQLSHDSMKYIGAVVTVPEFDMLKQEWMVVAKLSSSAYKQWVTLPSVYLITAMVKSTVQIIYFFFF